MTLSIKPTARDLVFSFKDSCNCCNYSACCKPNPPSQQRVYITSIGFVERYSSVKVFFSTNGKTKAFERSISHLNISLDKKVTSFNGITEEFAVRIDGILKSIHHTKEVNLAHVEGINDSMLEYYAEKSPKPVTHGYRF